MTAKTATNATTAQQLPTRFLRIDSGDTSGRIAYDDAGGSIAARLWWMLRAITEPVAVLDGGLTAWPGELTTDVPDVEPVARRPRAWPADTFRCADDVAATRAAVYDARTAERYAHGDAAIDPRPGHIPGALNVPWAANLGTDGRLCPAAELRELYAAAVDRGAVAYCGSGVTSCLNLLAMEIAGIADTALYAGSWSQWGADRSRPVEQC